MKAAIHDTFGEPTDVMVCRETVCPTPGPGQVRVKTTLSPIHNHDLWTIRGNYGYKPELPNAIGGSEALGTIEAVGEGVDPAMVGTRVTIAGMHGTWAEFFIAPATGVLPLPDAISDVVGAQLIAMPFSAIALLEDLRAKEGDWIVQTAANGAVGKVMVTLAKSRGIRVLNLVRREAAAQDLPNFGIDNVISTSDAGWKQAARTLIGTPGAVSAIDSVGGQVSADLIDLLGTDGELVVFGTATGAPIPLPSGVLIFKHIRVRGFWASRVSRDMAPETRKRLITELATLAATGQLKLESGGFFALKDISSAVTAALTPGRAGKVMMRP
ncbi:MAG: zinc-binding dehydrogenase [Myxococcota bacterium]